MKFLAPYLFLLFIPLTWSQEVSLNATNSDWYSIAEHNSLEYPNSGQWQKMTANSQYLALPAFPKSGLILLQSEVADRPVPRMLNTAIYPPGGGTIRFGERDIARYVEFLDEKAYASDNTIEYALDLEGQWSLNKKYTSDPWLIEFVSGHENWLEILHENKVIAEAKGQIILKGSDLPAKGQLQIRASSIKKDNKGLIEIQAYQAFEYMMPDVHHLGLTELLKLPAKWQAPTTQNIQAMRKAPESTPAAFKRLYSCSSLEDTQNILISKSDNITAIQINGQEIPADSTIVPKGLLKKGENEIIYYCKQVNSSLHKEFKLTPFRPLFIKTTVDAEEHHVIKPMIRGTRAAIYINGQFAGNCLPEKNEAFGMGLFKKGENEIALCFLQDSSKVFLEYINLAKINPKTALILPWKKSAESTQSLKVLSPGPDMNFSGTLLSETRNSQEFSSQFILPSDNENDLELDFNNSNRLPAYQFSAKYSAPFLLRFNGEVLKRKGSSFILPKNKIKKLNTISFFSDGLTIPEPTLYSQPQKMPASLATLKLISRQGRKRLHASSFFKGETLTWQLNFDSGSCDTLYINQNGDSSVVKVSELKNAPIITTPLKESGSYKLSVKATLNSKEVFTFEENLNIKDYPENPNGWLRANGQLTEVTLNDLAFFSSESNLFPEKFPVEWLHRELISDGDELQFGPLKTWSEKKKFSIYEFLPNGNSVFDKFHNRLYTALKIKSRGLPCRFVMNFTTKDKELWESAAFVLQYLKWLEENKIEINWQLPTLKDYRKKYIDNMSDKATQFVSFRKNLINTLVKQMALNAAPGSTFEENYP